MVQFRSPRKGPRGPLNLAQFSALVLPYAHSSEAREDQARYAFDNHLVHLLQALKYYIAFTSLSVQISPFPFSPVLPMNLVPNIA